MLVVEGRQELRQDPILKNHLETNGFLGTDERRWANACEFTQTGAGYSALPGS